MRSLRSVLAAAVFLVAVLPLASAAQSDEKAALGREGIESVLFVGNSLVYTGGGVDKNFTALTRADEDPASIDVDAITAPGRLLLDHVRAGTADEITSGAYSVVVLQGGVHKSGVDAFLEGARTLDAAVRESGGQTVLYMTWFMEPYPSIDLDGIAAVHRQLGEALGARVAPVGLAVADAQMERPDIELLGPDRIHPTAQGAYLAAAVIYATIFDQSPEGLLIDFPSTYAVSDEEVAFLQRIARETVEGWAAEAPVE